MTCKYNCRLFVIKYMHGATLPCHELEVVVFSFVMLHINFPIWSSNCHVIYSLVILIGKDSW